jgi:hypothetical protein
MEQFPEAGYGLCSLEQDQLRIFPFICNPAEAYHRHYFELPLFHKAPLSSIIRKDVFEKVGGFKSIRMAGDFEMWHRLSLNYSVVLMPHGIAWYRKHDNQEMNSYKDYYLNYLTITREYISNPLCPLSEPERNNVLKKTNRSESRFIIKELMKGKKGINYLRRANTSLPKVILNSFS